MADQNRPIKSRWLTRQLAFAHNVLADPTATKQQRHAARCRLNRMCAIRRDLRPVPAMKRGLDVDKSRRWGLVA
jgi:hypothetical protein